MAGCQDLDNACGALSCYAQPGLPLTKVRAIQLGRLAG